MSNPKSPDPEVMSASDVRQHFGDVVNRVARGEGRVVVEKHGAPTVGLVSMNDLRSLERLDSILQARQARLETLNSYFEGIPSDEWEQEVEKAFDEMRRERRATREVKTGTDS